MNKFKINFRMTVTALLPLLFLPIMCFHYVPKVLHEVLGILWLLLVLIHIGQNRQWFASLKRGRWPILRIIGTAVDMLLLVVLVHLLISILFFDHLLFSNIENYLYLHLHMVYLDFYMLELNYPLQIAILLRELDTR